MKKIISMFLALVMALALAVPAMADDVKVEGSIQLPTINVVLPSTASMILNPYGLNIKLDKNDTTGSTAQIISPVMQVKNLSDIGIKVDIQVAGTKGKGTADFSSADLDPDATTPVTTKVANVIGYFKIVANADLATFAVPSTADGTGDGEIQLATVAQGSTVPYVAGFNTTDEADTRNRTNVLAPSKDKKTAEDKGILAFTFSGTAVASPKKTEGSATVADPWTDKDTLGATVTFTFTAVAEDIYVAPSTP